MIRSPLKPLNKDVLFFENEFPADYLVLVRDAWRACGLDERLLASQDHALDMIRLADQTTVSGFELLAVYQSLTRHYHLPVPFSLLLAERFNFTSAGVLGLAIISARDVRQAVSLLIQYLPVCCPGIHISVEHFDDALSFSYQLPSAYESAGAFIAEILAAVIKRFFVYFNVSPRICDVTFLHVPLYETKYYRDYFGCEVRFNAATNGLYVADINWEANASVADERALTQLQTKLDARLAQQNRILSWPARVRSVVNSFLAQGKSPVLDEVAGVLNVSSRTLERRLQADGERFNTLCQSCRLSIALEILADPEMPVVEAGYRSGYKDNTAFYRFFKRMTGETPGAYRQRILG